MKTFTSQNLKEWVKKYLPILKEIYFVGMIIDMGCYMFPHLVNTYNYVVKLFPLFGMCIMVLDVYVRNEFYKKKYFKYIFCIAVFYGITCVINYNTNLFGNLKALFWLLSYFCVYYVYDSGFRDRKKYYKSICRIFNIIIVFNLVCCIGSLLLFILNIGISNVRLKLTFGYVQGFGRLFGVTSALTSSARIAVISVILSIIVILIKGKAGKGWKTVYTVNALLSYLFIVGSGVRASYLLLAVICAVYVFGISYAYRLREEKTAIRLLKSFLRSGLCVGIIVIVLLIGNKLCVYIPEIGRKLIPAFEITTDSGYQIYNTSHTYNWDEVGSLRSWWDMGHVEDITSRFDDAAAVAKLRPIFGTGVGGADTYKKSLGIDENSPIVTFMYFNILIFSGVAGLIVFVVSHVLIFVSMIRRLVASECTNQSRATLLLMGVCMSFLVYTGVIYANGIMPTLYWFLLGCMAAFADNLQNVTVDGNEK